jgi:hypothetical protein
MTKDEAEAIISRIGRDETIPWKSRHFLDRLEERGYSMLDVFNVLRHHHIPRNPSWDDDYGNHVVHLRGKSKDGRATDVLLGLREVGPCQYITIKDRSKRKRTSR